MHPENPHFGATIVVALLATARDAGVAANL